MFLMKVAYASGLCLSVNMWPNVSLHVKELWPVSILVKKKWLLMDMPTDVCVRKCGFHPKRVELKDYI